MNKSRQTSITMGVFFIYGIILTFVNWSDGFFLSTNELPCEFQDSINITNGKVLPDGSILYNGIQYNKQQFDTVNYRLINNVKRVKVDAHLRGCPCNIKPCIRLCCPLGSFVNMSMLKRGTILQEIPCYQHELAKNYKSEVYDQITHQSQNQTLDQHFSYVVLSKPTKFYKLKNYQITNVKLTSFHRCVFKLKSIRMIILLYSRMGILLMEIERSLIENIVFVLISIKQHNHSSWAFSYSLIMSKNCR